MHPLIHSADMYVQYFLRSLHPVMLMDLESRLKSGSLDSLMCWPNSLIVVVAAEMFTCNTHTWGLSGSKF